MDDLPVAKLYSVGPLLNDLYYIVVEVGLGLQLVVAYNNLKTVVAEAISDQ